jgi:hypothetical protein
LEKQFGFRRLGPSAQARLARMLATNDALGRDNRLFVERYINAYPHQTLFTREEIKRVQQLSKLPSPGQPPVPATAPGFRHPRPPPAPLLLALSSYE